MKIEKTPLISRKAGISAFVFLILGTFLGIIIAHFFFSNPEISGHTNHTSVIYTDFISILLTTITVLFALVGIFLAIMAFVGYTNIEKTIHHQTKQNTRKLIRSALKTDGEIWKLISKELDDEDSEFTQNLISKVHSKYLDSISQGGDENDELDDMDQN